MTNNMKKTKKKSNKPQPYYQEEAKKPNSLDLLKSVTANSNKASDYTEEELKQIKNRTSMISYYSALENKCLKVKSLQLNFGIQEDCDFISTFKDKPCLLDAI